MVIGTDVAPGQAAPFGTEPHGEIPTGADGMPAAPRQRLLGLRPVPIIVLVVGLAITLALALTARALHDNNENHLLQQRVNEAVTVITAASANTQTPLSSAAILADGTQASPAAFTRLMKPLATGRPFVSASIWVVRDRNPRPVVVVGAKPQLAAQPVAEIRAFLDRTRHSKTMTVRDLLDAKRRGLGYGYSAGPNDKYVVYAESSLPQNRRAAVESNSAFSDLDYAIYLGTTDDPRRLLAASVGDPRFPGRSAAGTIPFGDAQLRIVMAPRRELGGNLLARLPWLIGGIGLVLGLAAALLTERLVRRRAYAEQLARLNARLFSEQRSVAQTLQHSLLPAEPPEFPGLDLAVRYVPGVDGVDVGGDWYDVIGVGDGRVIVVVGDVSGRGLRAATVMASLRYSIRAYAAQGDPPEAILAKLSKLIDVRRDGHFATVLCGLVDVSARRVTFANSGHPNPLLVTGTHAEFAVTNVGPPVGVAANEMRPVTVTVPPDGFLLMYTDGLFERRGENPDVGLERLRDAATGYDSLERLLDGLLGVLTPDGGNDDTAILAVRWLP
ncbi:MAG TPA: PP2C family protein-serine/threonine phosphatase [Acidimicrobiia bacterium]|nr:PP2C family protein-serine/threonine phosphatase [Acidimicrobiia bacterium]